MIIVISGPLGVGKTQTSWALLELIEQCVMIDGDFVTALNPFTFRNPADLDYLYATTKQLIGWHYAHGFRHTIFNYVYETADSFQRRMAELAEADAPVHAFYLAVDPDEAERRVRTRANYGALEWEVSRARELVGIQQAAGALDGVFGTVIDTSSLSIEDVAGTIMGQLWSHEAIEIIDYDAAWPARYEAEAGKLREVFGDLVELHHIGSSSVTGLAAKPIIDIAGAAADLDADRQLASELRKLGYVAAPPDPDAPGHVLFVKGLPRSVHLHVYAADSLHIEPYLTFRDRLRADDRLRDDYAALKRRLAAEHSGDRKAYTDAKDDFIRAADGSRH